MMWLNKYNYTGWMVVPHNLHPFGNEWHTILCALYGIIYHIELVEGKDQPPHLPETIFDGLGKTVELLLLFTRLIWHTGTCVVLYSVFYVFEYITKLHQRGVNYGEVIKKCWYFPKHISSDKIVSNFKRKTIGNVYALQRMFKNAPSHVYCQKEPNYTKMIILTYSYLNQEGDHPKSWKFKVLAILTKK